MGPPVSSGDVPAGEPVRLHVYDLSQGMARNLSPMVLGRTIDGIWHTGVVVFNTEYYFGGGICCDAPFTTPYGTPGSTEALGNTTRTRPEFEAFLLSVSRKYSMETYHLLDNNCNNFSDACVKFLLGPAASIPSYILDLPQQALNSPLGPMLRPMLENMQAGIRDASAGHEFQSPPGAGAGVAVQQGARGVGGHAALAQLCSEPHKIVRVNLSAVVGKYNELYGASLTDEELPSVDSVLANERTAPSGKAFCAIDVLRLCVVKDASRAAEAAKDAGYLLRKYVLDESAPRPERMMTLRVAANLFVFPEGKAEVIKEMDTLVEAAAISMVDGHSGVVHAATTLAANLACEHRRSETEVLGEEAVVRLLFVALEVANNPSSIMQRIVVPPLLACIGALIDRDLDARELAKSVGLELGPYLNSADEKVKAVASDIRDILQSGR